MINSGLGETPQMKGDLHGGSVSLISYFQLLKSFTKRASGPLSPSRYNTTSDAIKAAQDKANKITDYPFIKGCRNNSAMGSSIPYQIGEMYNTPQLLTDGFFTISGENGENQYFNSVMSLGFGKQKIKKVFIGEEEVLSDPDGLSESTHEFYYLDPEHKNINTFEIAQSGNDFTNPLYKQKVVTTLDGTEIKHDFNANAEQIIKQLPDYVKRLEVCIQFNGLRQYNTTADAYEPRGVTVIPAWSNDNGQTWQEMFFEGMDDNYIRLNTNHTVRFVAKYDFTPAESYGKKILLRLEKITPKLESNSTEDCYLTYYQCFCYDNELSNENNLVDCQIVDDFIKNNTTRIGITLKANINNNNYVEDIHTISQTYARIWDGVNWTADKAATSNPAAEILELRTSNIHPHSQFSSSEIDLESLAALYVYCERNNYACNALFTSGQKKSDIINGILATVNAREYIDAQTGLYTYAIDQEETTPKALINAENVINMSYFKDMGRKPDGLKVAYTNNKVWQIDNFYAMLNGTSNKSANDTVTDFNIDFVTDYNHAYKFAQRKLRELVLRPDSVVVTVGKEFKDLRLFNTVNFSMPILRVGLVSSTINKIIYDRPNSIIALELTDYVQFESGKRYGVIISCVAENGNKLTKREILGNGKTRLITLAEPINESIMPQEFNIVTVGELDAQGGFNQVSSVLKVNNITSTNYGYELELVNYDESIYQWGTIPAYKSNITRPPLPSAEIPNPELMGLNGASGYNTRYIQLFIRSSDRPTDLPFNFSQDFSNPELMASIAELNGWQEGLPAIREDSAPAWEIHQTQASQKPSALFESDKWSVPVKCSQDTEISKDEIQQMINDSIKSGAPIVYATSTFASVAVDDKGISPTDQEFKTTIHVLQADEELEFQFGSIIVPVGWHVSHVGNVLLFKIDAGAYITSGTIDIPILYRAYLSMGTYGDELLEAYTDEDGELYGSWVLSTDSTIYHLGYGYSQLKGGRYLNDVYGRIASISDIPSNVIIGDFLTWQGADAISQLCYEGKFLQGAVYKWTGEIWKKDTAPAHLMTALNDILSDSQAQLDINNSEIVGLFSKIVSQEIIAANLTVTGTAFMKKLIAANIYAENFASVEKTTKDYTDLTAEQTLEKTFKDLGFNPSDDVTIISGGKIKTSFINTNEIKSSSGFFDSIKITGNAQFNGLVNATRGFFYSHRENLNNTTTDDLITKLNDVVGTYSYSSERLYFNCTGAVKIVIPNVSEIKIIPQDIYKTYHDIPKGEVIDIFIEGFYIESGGYIRCMLNVSRSSDGRYACSLSYGDKLENHLSLITESRADVIRFDGIINY